MSEFSSTWIAKHVERPGPRPSPSEAPVAKAIHFAKVESGGNDEVVLSHLLFDRLLQDLQAQLSAEHFDIVLQHESRLRMALEELFTNASRYGHPDDASQSYSPEDFVFGCSFDFSERLRVVFTMTDCGPDLEEPIEDIAKKALEDVELPHYRGLTLFLQYCRMSVEFIRNGPTKKLVKLVGEYE